jgi:two-component system, NarL family, invasion response regulator UvrY
MAKIILVADDNPRIRKTLCQMFSAESGYEVCAEAANREEAIALALKHRPQLIIMMDLAMPVMSGLQASRELKRLMPDAPFDRIVSKDDGNELIGHVRSLIPA